MSKLHAIVTLSVGLAACGDPPTESLGTTEQALYDCNAPTQRMTCAPPSQSGKRYICHGTANRRVKIAVALDSAHAPGVAHGGHDLADAEPGASAADTGDTGLDCDCEPRVCEDVCSGAPNGVACDDGDPCTDDGACENGVCSTGPARCHAGDLVDACTRLTGTCSAGICAIEPITCPDDDNACTADACDPTAGCVRPPIDCLDEGDACTVESCDPAFGCVRSSLVCNDGNECTSDTCEPASGCVATAIDCVDDGNVCTTELCDPSSGCTRIPNTNRCDDGDAATTGDVCNAGECHGVATCSDERILVVDAAANAIRLERSAAAHIDLSAGAHAISVAGTAHFSTGGPGGIYPWVIGRYRRAGGGGFELFRRDETTTIELEEAGPLWGFLFDQWGAITFNDNGGVHTVTTDQGSFSVSGTGNTFLLESTVAARMSLPAGTWRVEVTGDAEYASGHPFGSVMVGAYGGFPASDSGRAMLAMGTSFDFTSLGYGGDFGANNFFAFFADYGDFSDNAGSAQFRFCRL